MKKIVQLNAYIYTLYLLVSIIEKNYPGQFIYFKLILGLMIFFIVGVDLVLILTSVKKIDFDYWEFLTLSVLASFFIMPLIIFAFYKVFGFISEESIVSVYVAVSAISISAANFYKKNEIRKN